jgi:hypothetical protein
MRGKLGRRNEDDEDDWPQPLRLLLPGGSFTVVEFFVTTGEESLTGGLVLTLLILLLLLLLELLPLLLVLNVDNGTVTREAGMSVELFHFDFFDLDVGKRPPGPLLSSLKGLE